MDRDIARRLLDWVWVLAFGFLLGCEASSAEDRPLPQAATLKMVVQQVADPWVVRVGETASIHVDVLTASGGTVPEASIEGFKIGSTRSKQGVIADLIKVEIQRVGDSGFDIRLTPQSVPDGHSTQLGGVLSTKQKHNPSNASAVQFELPDLVIYGGAPSRLDPVTSVTRLRVGEVRPMAALVSAVAEPGFADLVRSDVSPTWTSSNPAVATVTPGGLIQGVGIGSAQLTAQAGGLSAQIALEVAAGELAAPPDGSLPLIERISGSPIRVVWPVVTGQSDILNDITVSDDRSIAAVATDSRGYPFVVGTANGNVAGVVHGSSQILMAEWTGSGFGFSWIGLPFEHARDPRIAIDSRDRLYVVYLGHDSGVRIAERDAKKPDSPWTFRTASWTPDGYQPTHIPAVRRLNAPSQRPYVRALLTKEAGGLYLGTAMLTCAPQISPSGCVESVQLFDIGDQAIVRSQVRLQPTYEASKGGRPAGCSPLPTGGGTALQLLSPLAGETWPRFLYYPPDRDEKGLFPGMREYRVLNGQWTSEFIAVKPGVGPDPLGPVAPVEAAMLAARTSASDPEVALMLALNLKSGKPLARLVKRLADGSWQQLMGPEDPQQCSGDGELNQLCGGTCTYGLKDEVSCFGSTFNKKDAAFMPEGNRTPAIGFVNERLLFTSGAPNPLAYVLSRTGGTRRDIFADALGRQPDDVVAIFSQAAWHFGKGRVFAAGLEQSGKPDVSAVLTVVTQPRATPRFGDSFATGQRMGDSYIPDAFDIPATADASGRLWVASTSYQSHYGAVFASDPAQTAFHKVTLPPQCCDFVAPHQVLSAGSKVVVVSRPQFFAAWVSSDAGATWEKSLVTADQFAPTSHVLLPGGQYFAVETHSPTTFDRRYSPNLFSGAPLQPLDHPEWNLGSYLVADEDAAVLIKKDDATVLMLSHWQGVILETFGANGERSARIALDWTGPRAPALLTAVVQSASTLGILLHPVTGDTGARYARIDLASGKRTVVDIASGHALPRSLVRLANGHLAAGWVEKLADGRQLAMVAFSKDDGASWGKPKEVWPGGSPMQVLAGLTPLADGQVLALMGDRGILERQAPRLWPEKYLEFANLPTDFLAVRVGEP